jgi:cytochrome P450
MHRRKDLWGADAAKFRPERWDSRRPGWEYLPFNGGPRICIGQQFALTEAGFVTVRMLQKFESIQGQNTDGARHNLTLTSCPAAGAKLKIKVAKD